MRWRFSVFYLNILNTVGWVVPKFVLQIYVPKGMNYIDFYFTFTFHLLLSWNLHLILFSAEVVDQITVELVQSALMHLLLMPISK